MKIFINGRFLTQRQTGVQRYAYEVLLALDAMLEEVDALRNVEVVVVAPAGAAVPSLSRIRYRSAAWLSGHLWEQVTLPLLCKTSLLVGFGATGPLLKERQVVTMHDAAVYAVPNSFGKAFRYWYRSLMPLLARRARHLMTVSEFSKRELRHYLGAPASKARVTGEGWDHVLRYESDLRVLQTHALRPGRYVLAVGSIAPHKNLSVVAEAAGLLGDLVDVEVVLAGASNAGIFGKVDDRTQRRLRGIGYVTDGELRALYEHAAAFVHPSKYEGFGIPPLEAMALGCPVLAARAGALPEVCGDGAWYFRPDDAEGLAALIRRLFADEGARADLISRGRARAQIHQWRAAANQFISLFIEEARRDERASSPSASPAIPNAGDKREQLASGERGSLQPKSL